MKYDYYNREERALCAHLFRLLHQWIAADNGSDFMNRFINQSGLSVEQEYLGDIKIYTEVALIRDAYFHRKPYTEQFMDDLSKEVIQQENLNEVRIYSELPDILKDSSQTHPGQIRRKAREIGIALSQSENSLYAAIQGMFNAKPDLAITIKDSIIVYEAKYTQRFNEQQLQRTERISQVWGKLLYCDLGFDCPPRTIVSKIGPKVLEPDISWEWIFQLAAETYPSSDRTYVAMSSAVDYLNKLSRAKSN